MPQTLGATSNAFLFDGLLTATIAYATKGETLATGSNIVGGLCARGQILGRQTIGTITSQGKAPILSYTVANGGSGYTTAPTVTVTDRAGSGTGAAPGAVTLVAGVITAIALGTAGTGYLDPVVVVTGGGGTGARVTANLNATTGNTGNGTLTAVSSGTRTIQGNYVLICSTATVNGGTFTGYDPNGAEFGNFIMTAGAGLATAFVSPAMKFTLTDGATDFVVGDAFVIGVAAPATAKLLPRDPGATDGSQTPYAILADSVDASAADVVVAVYTFGEFNQNYVIGFTEDIREALRTRGIIIKSAVAV